MHKMQVSFFKVFESIVRQLKYTYYYKTVHVLLNSLLWKYKADDHQYLAKSDLLHIIRYGNGIKDKDLDPLRYSWGHTIQFKDDNDICLSHSVVEFLTSFVSNILSKVLVETMPEDRTVIEKQEEGDTILVKKFPSHISMDSTEALMQNCFAIVFEQLNRYSSILKSFDPIEYNLFKNKVDSLKDKNSGLERDTNNIFEDELTPEELKELREKETTEEQEREAKRQEDAKQENASARNYIEEIANDDTNKEMKKLTKMYDHSTITKLLRLLDMLISVAGLNENMKYYALRTLKPLEISNLISLSLLCSPDHARTIFNIFKNFVQVCPEPKVLEETFEFLPSGSQAFKILNLPTKIKLKSKFPQFLLNLVIKIRGSQWEGRRFESTGSLKLSWMIVEVLKAILSSQESFFEWNEQIEKAMDSFFSDVDSYSSAEFDTIMSLLEGGEFLGITVGAHGINQQRNKFTILGFVKKWIGVSTDWLQFEIDKVKMDYTEEDDQILGFVYYDDTKDSKLEVIDPKTIKLIPSVKNEQSSYLMNKERFCKFIGGVSLDTLPDKSDAMALTRRAYGMKILINLIEKHSEKMSFLLDEDLKNRLIAIFMKEMSSPS